MNSLVKVSLRYGVLAAVLDFGLLAGLYFMGRHPFLIPLYLDFRIILFFVFIFFALREIRDYHQGRTLYFWQGIFGSFLFTVCFAVIASLSIVVFINFVPAFLSDYIKLETEFLESLPPEVIERIGKEVYERNLKMLPATNAAELGITYFVQSFVISFFISILLSVTLRREPNPNL